MKVKGGYLCRLSSEYLSANERGKWITDTISVKASKKLYVKTRKHVFSTTHQMYVAAHDMRQKKAMTLEHKLLHKLKLRVMKISRMSSDYSD